ncbi:MAG: iron chelate uptake ABC transporter family permease subunit, partial [Clostridium sp.]|nr:iron chelate uptake ABC transporter family permease subunit [Clostridium sp.]
GKNIYFLVLAGMILGNLFGGMSTFMQVLLDPNEFLILQGKMFASFNNINTDLVGICTVIVVVVILSTYRDMKYLDVISLGQEQAINLGVPYKRVVMKTLMVISILISISTVLVGPITFLGILVVSLSREMQKTFKHTKLVTGAVVLGAFSLIFSILLVERVFAFETTSSVIINFVGGIYFIYIMIKESKR